MSDFSAEDCKLRGNSAFRVKQYAEAITWYSQAIQQDSNNAVYYNNRAAAYLETREYEKCIADTQKSVSLDPTAKAFSRKGKAHECLGQLAEAVKAYERAAEMDPHVTVYQEQLRAVQRQQQGPSSMPPPPRAQPSSPSAGGASQQPPPQPSAAALNDPWLRRAMYLDLIVLFGAIIHVVTMFFAAGFSLSMYQVVMAAMAARQAIGLVKNYGQGQGGAPVAGLNLAYLKHLVFNQITSTFCGQYLFVCLLFAISSSQPLHLFLAAIGIYVTADLVLSYYPLVKQMVNAAPMAATLAPKMEETAAKVRQNRDFLFANAALCEVCAGFMIPLFGSSMIHTIVFWQFLKCRYRSDGYSKTAFHVIYEQAMKLCGHRLAPSVLGKAVGFIAGWMHKAATG